MLFSERIVVRIFIVFSIVFFFFGCTQHSTKEIKPKQYRAYHKASDRLYYLTSDDVASHNGKTGFYPLPHYYDAFIARMELIKAAKKTIDMQYFIFSNDEVSTAFMDEVIKAADRGVKVRILVDDLLLKYRDKAIASIAAHPNIEIKLFNPTDYRGTLGWMAMGFNIGKYSRRMHNKMLIVDNSALVMGGRNIENVYFGVNHKDIFIDNDILAIGPLVAEASNKFETYWSFKRSVNIKQIYKGEFYTKEEIQKIYFAPYHRFLQSAYFQDIKERKLYTYFKKHNIPLIYAKAKLYYDLPEKIITPEDDDKTHLAKLSGGIHSVENSIVIINPYFVPNAHIMEKIKQMREEGIEIYILTNSLATNDAIPVYSEYSRYQKALLRLGVHLYEVNPHAVEYIFKSHKYTKLRFPKTSLHAKSMIIDGKYFVIGSFNLDPRSDKVNTEVVALIESKQLSQQEKKLFDYFIQPENAYRLSLEKAPSQQCIATCIPRDNTQVVWNGTKDGKKVKYYDNDADAGFLRRLAANILRYVPLGNQI